MHVRDAGRLAPKAPGLIETSFARDGSVPRTRGGDPRDLGATRSPSVTNTVLKQQLRQAGYPTCGVSTTPCQENARRYALHSEADGYVYVIDTAKLPTAKVMACPVLEFVPVPSVPGDEEVVLFAEDGGALPPEIIVEVIRVSR
jgi:hypothetical protein